MDEFGLIARYFARPVGHTALGVGDDAALIDPTPGCQTVVSCDMLVEGVHFLAGCAARALGHKALAVNLSDLAAMGATPRQALLGIALPVADEAWLAAFADGFAELAAATGVDWVGGDTTRGPLNLCVTVLGEVPCGQALLRRGARPGDDLWVSGTPGLAALGLAHLRGECRLAGDLLDAALGRLHTPQPRLALGIALRGVASACIDISDGLLADLGHLLRAADAPLAAEVDRAALTMSAAAAVDAGLLQRAVLSGGDDYELLFSAPPVRREALARLATATGVALTRIGRLLARSAATQGNGEVAIELVDGERRDAVKAAGYLHFG